MKIGKILGIIATCIAILTAAGSWYSQSHSKYASASSLEVTQKAIAVANADIAEIAAAFGKYKLENDYLFVLKRISQLETIGGPNCSRCNSSQKAEYERLLITKALMEQDF